jgi:hypothetical protein
MRPIFGCARLAAAGSTSSAVRPMHRRSHPGRCCALPVSADLPPSAATNQREETMRKYIIERELPAIGSAERQALREAAQKSNATLKELGPDIQWVESYVAGDKTFCVYLAKDEAIIHEHAKRSGFPANKVTEIRRMIDPTTATEA